MNALFSLDEAAILRIEEIREYSECPARRHKSSQYPRLALMYDPHRMLKAGDVRAVFSMTQINPGHIYRHLTVGVVFEGDNHFPATEVVYTLACYFGFTGASADISGLVTIKPSDWDTETDDEAKMITVSQKISMLA